MIFKAVIVIILSLLFAAESGAAGRIENTKHNLSAFGPGSIRVQGQAEVCVFCHTRHNGNPLRPEWIENAVGTNYIPYSSSTLKASPGQPTGSSLLCLSCHDGTTALSISSSKERDVSFKTAMRSMLHKSSNLGTDLSDDHPVSLYYYDSYNGNPSEYAHPDSLPKYVKLDGTGQVQCTSCHDPHNNTWGQFLRTDNSKGQLCTGCHNKYAWRESSHRDATFTRAQHETGGGCGICHASHNAGGRERLLKFAAEENNCLNCHSNMGGAINLESEFEKPYRHPLNSFIGVHDPVEATLVDNRHIECVDCHNPHATQSGGLVSGALKGVSGISGAGANIDQQPGVTAEYQLCFRCHGDSRNKQPPLVNRWWSQTNVREEFSPVNASYHPVMAIGKNTNVPSLMNELSNSTIISCSSCHGNNDSTGPQGPHGSVYEGLLVRSYATQDLTSESTSAYALCYGCHSRASILADESFTRHSMHVTGDGMSTNEKGTSCSTCHDPHASNQERLINFDNYTVDASSSGRLEFYSSGLNAGTCYLSCHDKDHDPLCYGPNVTDATDC